MIIYVDNVIVSYNTKRNLILLKNVSRAQLTFCMRYIFKCKLILNFYCLVGNKCFKGLYDRLGRLFVSLLVRI